MIVGWGPQEMGEALGHHRRMSWQTGGEKTRARGCFAAKLYWEQRKRKELGLQPSTDTGLGPHGATLTPSACAGG